MGACALFSIVRVFPNWHDLGREASTPRSFDVCILLSSLKEALKIAKRAGNQPYAQGGTLVSATLR